MTGQKFESAATTGIARGPAVERLLGLALRHHRSGRLADAEPLYRSILATQPDHLLALQFLGVLAHQVGNSAAAIELIGKALALDARIPDAQFNMGSVLQGVGRHEEAAAHYAETIRLCPDHVAAHYELASVLAKQEKLDQAAEYFRRALTLHPRYVEALINLGLVLMRQGDLPGAMEHWRRALTLDPSAVTAHMNIALVQEAQGNVAAAIGGLRRVLQLQPAHSGALCALGPLLHDIGEIAEALDCAVRALRVRETISARTLFVQCIRHLVELPDGDNVRDLVLRALSEPWSRPSALAAATTRFVKLNPAVRAGIDRALAQRRQGGELLGSFDFAIVCRERLLTTLLASTPIRDMELERFLTEVRFALLDTAGRAGDGDPVDDAVLEFCCALASQCFINEYVFAQDPDEAERAASLQSRLSEALQSGAPVPVMWLVVVAAYFPLGDLPGSDLLLNRSWPAPVAALLTRQVREPLVERECRASIPALTPIDSEISLLVRHLYEENPYPRWMKSAPTTDPETIDFYLRTRYPAAPFTNLGKGSGVEILVAGCGTGLQSVECGWHHPDAYVLAVDLSLASLAYAKRQTRAAGLANIAYAQADLMQLGSLGRSFDIVEATGVLHHLADPEAGWRLLLSLLRPGGFMKIGLYSARAREDIVAGRALIAERGYAPTPDGIRRCRQDILAAEPGSPLRNITVASDFFTVGECRDLLFHPCEHRFTLPRISAFLTEHDLGFIGFELDAHVKWQYAQRFPADPAMIDLDCWHRYEEDNPRTFIRMYQFWIQKKHAGSADVVAAPGSGHVRLA